MKNPIKLKSALITALLLNSITLSSGSPGELEAINRAIAVQGAEIKMHRAIAVEIFESYKVPKSGLIAAADSLVLDSSGLAYLNKLRLTSIAATSSPTGIVIKKDEKYEAPVRVFIDLFAQIGFQDPARTWSPNDTLAETSLRHTKSWLPKDTKKNILDWVLEQTQSIMAVLGDSARVIPGKTLRGGVSAQDDRENSASIISKMLIRKEAITSARMDAELRNLFENLLSVKWFARLGPDKAKRATFIALCLDLSMGGITLTDEEFTSNYNFAQNLALVAAK